MTSEELMIRFTHHAPRDNQTMRYAQIRGMGHEMAVLINDLTPESREQALAFTALEECVMWANASIARREQLTPPPDAR